MKAYSFDWDDNILHMDTMVNMEKKEGDNWTPVKLSTSEYAELKEDPSYRYPNNNIRDAFIDFDNDDIFLQNVEDSIKKRNFAPSFNDFKEALIGARSISIITARPQSPETLKKGVKMIIDNSFNEEEIGNMVENIEDNYDFTGQLDEIIEKYIESNYYYPVSFKEREVDVTKEKGIALDDFVKKTIHAFEKMDKDKYNKISVGFSDDDVDNIKEVVKKIDEVMSKLYPDVEFFIYDTSEKGKNKVIVHTT